MVRSPGAVGHIGVREKEIRKLESRLIRARRIAQRSVGQKNSCGRPSRITLVQPVIRDLIAKRKWNATESIKALTREVNSVVKSRQPVSADTVTRALDLLHDETKDRRFERVRRERRPRRK